MSTRVVNNKQHQSEYHDQDKSRKFPENVTEFPRPANKASTRRANSASASETIPFPSDNNTDLRTIDEIADYVLEARYLSAEEQDDELSRLLDLVLLRIGQKLAALDAPSPRQIPTH